MSTSFTALWNGPRRAITGVLLLVAVLASSSSLNAQNRMRRISPELLALRPDDTAKVIVQFKPSASVDHEARFSAKGARLRHDLSIVRASAYDLPVSVLSDLANDPDVEYVGPDRSVAGTLYAAEPAIGANTAFSNGYNGNGVAVAVIDSGIQSGDVCGAHASSTTRALCRTPCTIRLTATATVAMWPLSSAVPRPIPADRACTPKRLEGSRRV